jgi:hypothetical protein
MGDASDVERCAPVAVTVPQVEIVSGAMQPDR